jgi:hypothetical protein
MRIVKTHLKPEFLNRIDGVILFEDSTERRLRMQDVEAEFTGEAVVGAEEWRFTFEVAEGAARFVACEA